MPGKVGYFVESFEKATSIKYGYLLIDFSPHTDKKYQLRTRIFPDEAPTIVYLRSKDVT